jgi:tetratricopeptide (TPR) repeat protein
VHRRLAELYQASGKSALPDAKRQLEYARTIAPRDILILRALGKVKLDDGDKDGCEDILKDIEEMDDEAFRKNPENAALKARYLRERGDCQGEIDVLKEAFGNMPESHYVGDLLGQALLEADQAENAKKIYMRVLETMSDLVTDNVWSEATRLTAAIVCDKDEVLRAALERLDELRPDAGARQSISRGIERVSTHMALSESVLAKLKAFGWA